MNGMIAVGGILVLALVLMTAFVALVTYGMLQLLPGAAGNSLRRSLFAFCRPMLSLADRIAPVRIGALDFTPFLAALVILVLFRYALPWLFLAGLSLGR